MHIDDTNEQGRTSTFEAPAIVDYGDLTELTAGQSTGNFLDQTFPVNTPLGRLTFSG